MTALRARSAFSLFLAKKHTFENLSECKLCQLENSNGKI
jgi:hypothetical protein